MGRGIFIPLFSVSLDFLSLLTFCPMATQEDIDRRKAITAFSSLIRKIS